MGKHHIPPLFGGFARTLLQGVELLLSPMSFWSPPPPPDPPPHPKPIVFFGGDVEKMGVEIFG